MLLSRPFELPTPGWPEAPAWPPDPGGEGGSEPSPVLLPYNGTAVADAAVDVAAELAQPNALLWVLYVRPWDVVRAGFRSCLETSEEARRCVHHAVAELRRRGVPASGVLRDARRELVAHAIAAEAERLDVGSIILGTHGQGALLSTVMGSVSRKVARRSSRPVLLVRARQGCTSWRPPRS